MTFIFQVVSGVQLSDEAAEVPNGRPNLHNDLRNMYVKLNRHELFRVELLCLTATYR